MQIHAETLNRFCNQYKIIKHYIEDLPSQAIHTRFIAERWSIHETIAYLCRYQYVLLDRIKRISTEVNPFFVAYKPEEDHDYQFTAARTTGALLHDICRMRQDMTLMIKELSDSECSRVGTHAVLGRMNLCQWLEFFLLHESNQLYKIFKLAGQFWSNSSVQHGNVISMPRSDKQVDELAG